MMARWTAGLDGAYLVALAVALWGTGLALGIPHPLSGLAAPLRRRRLLAGVVLADVVAVPLLVWALVRILEVPGDFAIGLLLVGIASAGPLGIKAAELAGADVPAAVSFVVVLELANLAAIPLWVAVLLPDGTEVSLVDVVWTLVVVVLLPLAVEHCCRRYVPAAAARCSRPLVRVSNAALASAIAIVLAPDADAVGAAAGERVVVVALAVPAALGLGWLAAVGPRATRTAAALVTGIRANGPALAIAAASFPHRPDVRVAGRLAPRPSRA